MLSALLTRNPFYLVTVIVVALLVSAHLDRLAAETAGSDGASSQVPQTSREARGRTLFIRAFVGITLLVALFKGLSTPYGETVLFYLPEFWPFSGNPVTAEGMVSAGLDALQIGATLAVFSAFSAGADYYAILRSTPPALHQVGLITSIAITFVPQTVTRFLEIREAQALRGHRIRRANDLLPLVMPLLAGGMERSLDLAEAMEARGFSRVGASRRIPPALVQTGIAAGLGLTLVGATLFAFSSRDLHWLNWVIIAFGILLIVLTLRGVGRGSGRTRYRRSVWRSRDTYLLIASIGSAVLLLLYRQYAPGSLLYDPFPSVTMPPFDLVVIGVLALLLAPVLLIGRRTIDDRRQRAGDK
jgi:energy-coupling factor transport system permease protein